MANPGWNLPTWLNWRRCLAAAAVLYCVRFISPWVHSLFIDLGPTDCAFGAVSSDEFRQLLAQATAQKWTVVELFESKDAVVDGPIKKKGWYPPEPIGDKLFGYIQELTPANSRSEGRDLAAAHAVLRRMGAAFVNVDETSDGRTTFQYLLPCRHLRNLWLDCVIWPYLGISVVFEQLPRSKRHQLEYVITRRVNWDMSTGSLYDPGDVGRDMIGQCPQFVRKIGDTK